MHLFVCRIWGTRIPIHIVVDAAANRSRVRVCIYICVCVAPRAREEGPTTGRWDVAHVKAPHGRPRIRTAAITSGCIAGRAKMRGECGEHHVAGIDGWGVSLEFLANELEECRSGYEHTRSQVEDVKR